jgi:hypothetical protein
VGDIVLRQIGYLLDAVKRLILNRKPNNSKAIPERAIAYVIGGVDVVL